MNLERIQLKTVNGPYLNCNEDFACYDIEKGLYFVMDGFGGVGVGDLASRSVAENMIQFYGKLSEDADSTNPFFYSSKYLNETNALVNAAIWAHRELLKMNQKKELGVRGGSAGMIAAQSSHSLSILSSGNCYLYHFRQGKIETMIGPDQISFSTQDEVLIDLPMNGFGLEDVLTYQVKEIKINPKDQFLLLTDGACSHLSVEDIHLIFESQQNLADKINQLFLKNDAKGNIDNQSAMILEYSE